MQITVKGKQLDVGDALRTHVTSALDGIVEKYFNRAIDGSVTLSREAGHLYTADIAITVGQGLVMSAHAQADEPYPAFDLAADKIAKRLRRYKKKLVDLHQRKEAPAETVAKFILESPPEDVDDGIEVPDGEPAVIAEMAWRVETLSVADAVMRLDLSGMPALLFRNAGHGELNMIYRRPDGNIGWVDPKVSSAAAE